MALSSKNSQDGNSNQEVNIILKAKDEGSAQIALIAERLSSLGPAAIAAASGFTVLASKIVQGSASAVTAIGAIAMGIQGVIDAFNSPEALAAFQVIEASAKETLESTTRLSETIKAAQQIATPLIEGALYGKEGKKAVERIKGELKEIQVATVALSSDQGKESPLKKLFDSAGEGAGRVAAKIKNTIGPALDKLPLREIGEKIKAVFPTDILDSGKKAWDSFLDGFGNQAAQTKDALKQAVSGAVDKSVDSAKSAGQGNQGILADAGAAAQKTSVNYDNLLSQLDAVEERVTSVQRTIKEGIKVQSQVFEGISEVTGIISGVQEPVEIFSSLKSGVSGALEAMSKVSEEIFFVGGALQQMKSIVVGGPYDILIGQNVRLQEQLLSTKASIVANNKILQEGVKIEDPGKAIDALNAPVNAAISQIRRDSLELVGVTSNELVDVFNIISQQISNVNLDLDEAADLTISFAAGLGTINLPLNQARQEIQSILTGSVDMNSVLAKSLGITNAQLKTWIAQDVVYEKLNQRLEAFVTGNSKAAQTIGGVSSNIQEIFEEIGRKSGEPFLKPVVEALSEVYGFLSDNQGAISDVVIVYLDRIRVAATGAIEAFVALAERAMPLLMGLGQIIGGAVISAIDGLAGGLKNATSLLGSFLDIFGLIANSVGSSPFLGLFIQAKVLQTAFSSLVAISGSVAKVIPLVGEAMLFTQIRSTGLVNTVVNLNRNWGLFSSTLLVGAKYLDKIPGGMNAATGAIGRFFGQMEAGNLPGTLGIFNKLGQSFPIVARAGGVFAGSISAMIPSLAGAGVTMLGFAQSLGIGKKELSGLLGGLPSIISGIGETVGKTEIFGVKLTGVGKKLSGLGQTIEKEMGDPAKVLDNLEEAANNALKGVGDQVKGMAVRYGIWGAATLAVAGSLSVLIARNETFKFVLGTVLEQINKVASFLTDKLLSPIGLTTIAVVGLTAAIGSGLATEIGKMTVQMVRLITTNAPKFFLDMARGIDLMNKALLANTNPLQAVKDLFGQQPETFGDLELEEDKKKRQQAEKGKGAKATSPARLKEIQELSVVQAEVANSSGKFEKGMIGVRKETTAVSRSATGAAVGTTALGNAQIFAGKTAVVMGTALKALATTLGPILALVAAFTAIGYAIGEVTKTSQKQKELQEDLLKIYNSQKETLEKIANLQNKKVEDPLLDEVTEESLKTGEEKTAFRDGGAEKVLAVRKARELNDEGKKKWGIRRFAEQSMDVVGQGLAFLGTGGLTSLGSIQAYSPPSTSPGETLDQNTRDKRESTTALREVQSDQIAGTETIAGAGTFLSKARGEVTGELKGLILQTKETEKLLAEAQSQGREARARELQNKLDQEKEAVKAGQDEILKYATALEDKDFATAAQEAESLNIAQQLRDVVAALDENVEVTGVDFARLGTQFEQLRVEAENAVAFFGKGEGNPEQVKQRAGQLIASTQQQLESGLISSGQALENYAVLFQRNSALEADDQKKLQEAIIAARQKQVEDTIKLEEAKAARLKQLAAEGGIGQFESELGNIDIEREKAQLQLDGQRTAYEEQNNLRQQQFQDARRAIETELNRSRKELAAGGVDSDTEAALRLEIAGYQDSLSDLGDAFQTQQRQANRNFVTEEANLIAQIAESQNQELQLRLKELQDQATSALDESSTIRKAQLQELRKEGIVFEEQQNLALAQLQQERVDEELTLEKAKLQEYLKNPKRFEREIRESNKRIAQLTLERFETERASWEKQLTLFQRYVDDQAEAAKNAIEVENQELIKQSKIYEAISRGIEQRNGLLSKAQGFVQATGSAVADSLERIAKLSGNEVLQADLATNAAIIRRETLVQQLAIQMKIFEIEQKQAEIALVRREAENAIATAKAKQQIISAQGEVVVAKEQFARGDITEAELTSKEIALLSATTEFQGLELERGLIAQERQLQPIMQSLLREQQQQQAQSQLDQADISVLETLPQALAQEASKKLSLEIASRVGIQAEDRGDLATQARGIRSELQSNYAQERFGDAGIFSEDMSFREAQMSVGPGARNMERLREQGINFDFAQELGDISASPIASVDVLQNGEGFFDSGSAGRGSSGAFDAQTEGLTSILSGVEMAAVGIDESIAALEEGFQSISLDNLQEALPDIVGRDAIINATFESAGNVQGAIDQGLAESNVELETITHGLEPLAEVRDLLGIDGPLSEKLDNLDLEPYLGENTRLLNDTSSISASVERIATAIEAEPEAAGAGSAPEGEGEIMGPPLPPPEELPAREISSFIRTFGKVLSPDALAAARAGDSANGRRISETELRSVVTDTLAPFLQLNSSKLNLANASTDQILDIFRQSFATEETTRSSRGGSGGSNRTSYEIKPNLTFNVNGNVSEREVARQAMKQFEEVLDRALATS